MKIKLPKKQLKLKSGLKLKEGLKLKVDKPRPIYKGTKRALAKK